jgi:LPXTG-site transpeptidase (sortase) family protein
MKIAKRQSRTSKRFILPAICVLLAVLLIGAYTFYSINQKNDRSSQLSSPPKLAKAAVDGTKKTAEEKDSYVVPADHPRHLIIESQGISVNILPMGLTETGALDAPKSAWEVGWYDHSTLPGSGHGALLIDGHVNDALNSPGVFYKIHTLKSGDEIKIERGDNQIVTYQVVKSEQQPIERVDMAKMLQSIEPEKEGLNLITCGGEYNYKQQTYDDRVLVYAERVS